MNTSYIYFGPTINFNKNVKLIQYKKICPADTCKNHNIHSQTINDKSNYCDICGEKLLDKIISKPFSIKEIGSFYEINDEFLKLEDFLKLIHEGNTKLVLENLHFEAPYYHFTTRDICRNIEGSINFKDGLENFKNQLREKGILQLLEKHFQDQFKISYEMFGYTDC